MEDESQCGMETISRVFEICGVKQSCELSPLFTFLNDISEHIGDGIIIDGLNINVLLYADDIGLVTVIHQNFEKCLTIF